MYPTIDDFKDFIIDDYQTLDNWIKEIVWYIECKGLYKAQCFVYQANLLYYYTMFRDVFESKGFHAIIYNSKMFGKDSIILTITINSRSLDY